MSAPLPHISAPSRPTVPGDPSIRRSDLISWAKIAAIVVTLLGGTWKLSSDATDIRHGVEDLHKVTDNLTVRADRTDATVEALSKAMPTVRELLSVDARVSALEALTRSLLEARIETNERAKQFFDQTWPQLMERMKRIEDKLDGRRSP